MPVPPTSHRLTRHHLPLMSSIGRRGLPGSVELPGLASFSPATVADSNGQLGRQGRFFAVQVKACTPSSSLPRKPCLSAMKNGRRLLRPEHTGCIAHGLQSIR